MRNHLLDSTLSLLGGAGLGAAIMYLFDPDLGQQRRRDVTETAGDALHTTAQAASDTARSVAGRISDYAQELADNLGSQASRLSSGLTDGASNLAGSAMDSARAAARDAGNSARDYASSATDRARGTRDDLVGRAGSLWSNARKSIAGERSHPVALTAGITGGTIGLLALGAGVMYFWDPDRGRGRRAWARDKVFSASRRAGRQARGLGRHLGNQLQGVAAEASNRMHQGWSGADEDSGRSAMPGASASASDVSTSPA